MILLQTLSTPCRLNGDDPVKSVLWCIGCCSYAYIIDIAYFDKLVLCTSHLRLLLRLSVPTSPPPPPPPIYVDKGGGAMPPAPANMRVLYGFWFLGLLNNTAYVIMIAGAKDILPSAVGLVCSKIPRRHRVGLCAPAILLSPVLHCMLCR